MFWAIRIPALIIRNSGIEALVQIGKWGKQLMDNQS